MEKLLSAMTLDELWQLFPIILTEHSDDWNNWYIEEEKRIDDFLKMKSVKINHIGSTAIKKIYAKPTVDILIEIPKYESMNNIKDILIKNGYTCMKETDNRKSFCLGYTEKGFAEKVFHLHLRYNGDNDELYFRDFLNDYELFAKEYESLKLSLCKKYYHDRDGYTNAKTDFVKKIVKLAKKEYKNRY